MERRASTRISEMREEEYEMRERVKNRRRERIEEKDENYPFSRKERDVFLAG